MLEVRGIDNGIVLDHIKQGNGIKIFNKLFAHQNLPVVLLMNVESKRIGKKDIIKIEGNVDLDLSLLGLIDNGITVAYISHGAITEKANVTIPKKVKGLFQCKNPRCITHTDDYAISEFKLVSANGKFEYECDYCEEITVYRL